MKYNKKRFKEFTIIFNTKYLDDRYLLLQFITMCLIKEAIKEGKIKELLNKKDFASVLN